MAEECHLTRLPNPSWSKFKRTRLLNQQGPGEFLAWIAGKKGRTLVLRDPSGARELRPSGPMGEQLLALPLETLVWVRGRVEGENIVVEDLAVVNRPLVERTVDYLTSPPDPRRYAELYYWYVRGDGFRRVALTRSLVLKYSREFLDANGFIELEPPVVGVVSDPGLRGARKLVTEAYGFRLELMSSLIMYKQLMASVFEKIYYVARNVREEPPENQSSGRHLFEFTQLDVEWGLSSLEDVKGLAERLLHYVHKRVLEEAPDVLHERLLDRSLFNPPFPVITYEEALKKADELGFKEEWGRELSFQAETAISSTINKPFWLMFFPKQSRGFYYYPLEDNEALNMDFNLILPWGFGEVLDGGCREYRYNRLLERIKSLNEDVGKYGWFLELALNGGIAPSCGWGLGVERLVRFMLGLKHVAYATLHPRLPGVLPP
ncbi:tRNA synthetase [Thermogladius calderae 1633]|uniref:tRNA synthetase n=1 Tax=Thermogladius calderae (strain DSM 22663 / VKM B-2946 / 1633) TaxID=1184251 RepID=I3TE71_THEC1|nr:asparagine synthetase A [Thermogladius calderae]AFK51059.1 tRNA synthetase [Thermogladius calderae 1633]